ncbi:hypothetical protein [Xenorhabdus littoralis]|uniref:hypothetical protein n=1 Tax=Xenorhabdus littoralis TaxID=2582835 RepID=UPI0029E7F777|nr:hypothetical protein [Xenorhabdus sp. psl]
MSEQRPMSIWRYLVSRDAVMTIVIPTALYNIAFRFGGVGAALLLTSLYSIILKFISKTQGVWVVIMLLLVSGISHYLYIHGHTLFDIKNEEIFRSVSGAASVVAVFGFYSLLDDLLCKEWQSKPLRCIPMCGMKSITWILVYLFKAAGLYVISDKHSFPIDNIIFFCGSPLTLLMVLFSFYWPRYRWRSNSKK